jgi:hypothetical protein
LVLLNAVYVEEKWEFSSTLPPEGHWGVYSGGLMRLLVALYTYSSWILTVKRPIESLMVLHANSETIHTIIVRPISSFSIICIYSGFEKEIVSLNSLLGKPAFRHEVVVLLY